MSLGGANGFWKVLVGVGQEIGESAPVSKPTDLTIESARLYFLDVKTRMPYKFGQQVMEAITCARAAVTVRTASGEIAEGWGETPLSVGWVWPTEELGYTEREDRLKAFCCRLAREFAGFTASGHPLEVGHAFQQQVLPALLESEAAEHPDEEPMPYLAGLGCLSAFDLAMYDAYGIANQIGVFESFNGDYLNSDLGDYLIAFALPD